jgi:hypothetical protein
MAGGKRGEEEEEEERVGRDGKIIEDVNEVSRQRRCTA